jgi:hypothetical protein
MRHVIRINQISAGRYCVTGATAIGDTASPVQDAALSLREAGYPDSDLIAVNCGEITVLPASLGSILRPRRKLLRSEIEAQSREH